MYTIISLTPVENSRFHFFKGCLLPSQFEVESQLLLLLLMGLRLIRVLTKRELCEYLSVNFQPNVVIHACWWSSIFDALPLERNRFPGEKN